MTLLRPDAEAFSLNSHALIILFCILDINFPYFLFFFIYFENDFIDIFSGILL